jgi:hypothetical protein
MGHRGPMPMSVPYPWQYMPYQMPSTEEAGMYSRMPGMPLGYPPGYAFGYAPKDEKDPKRERNRDKSSEKSVSSKKSKTSKKSNVK